MVRVLQHARSEYLGDAVQVRSDAYLFSSKANASLGLVRLAGDIPDDFYVSLPKKKNREHEFKWLFSSDPFNYRARSPLQNIDDFVVMSIPYEVVWLRTIFDGSIPSTSEACLRSDLSHYHMAYRFIILGGEWVYDWIMVAFPQKNPRYDFLNFIEIFNRRLGGYGNENLEVPFSGRLLSRADIMSLGWGKSRLTALYYRSDTFQEI